MIKREVLLGLGMAALASLFAPEGSACARDMAVRLTAHMPGHMEGAALPGAMPRPEEIGPANALVGMWEASVILGGETIIQSFESFTSDGLEFLNDNGSPMEGNVCFGVWTAGPRNVVKVYHPSWNYDSNGNLIGTVVIKEQFTLDPGANTFKGTVTVDTYDLKGNVAAPQLQAQLTGKRITAN